MVFARSVLDSTNRTEYGRLTGASMILTLLTSSRFVFGQAYELFAPETKERVSEQEYVSEQEQSNRENSLAFTEYSFPSIEVREDRATIERVASYSNEEEEGQDKAAQEMVLEDDGWRIVMRDEQYKIFESG